MLSLDGVSRVERERLESRGLGSSRTSGREASVGPLQESGTPSGQCVADISTITTVGGTKLSMMNSELPQILVYQFVCQNLLEQIVCNLKVKICDHLF